MARTFHFYQKNSSVRVTLSADNFEEAEKELFETVKSDYGWRVEDEDGDEEE
jgi:type II secretory pathway component PulL